MKIFATHPKKMLIPALAVQPPRCYSPPMQYLPGIPQVQYFLRNCGGIFELYYFAVGVRNFFIIPHLGDNVFRGTLRNPAELFY